MWCDTAVGWDKLAASAGPPTGVESDRMVGRQPRRPCPTLQGGHRVSNELAISVQNVGKCYHIYDRPSDRLKQSLSSGRRQYYREFWALRDVSFDVRRGESLGI